MSNHKYTPTTEEIRKSYIGEPTHFMDQLVGAEFDRWLATVVAAAEQRGAERALREAAYEWSEAGNDANVYAWLHYRADQIVPAKL